jgi:hypothetical protein
MSWRGLIRSRATGAAGDSAVVHGWEVWRDGRLVRPVSISPTLSSDPRLWDGLALESYDLPPCDIPDHEHPTHYLSLQTSGPARAETIEVIPRGGRDRVVWLGQSSRLVVSSSRGFSPRRSRRPPTCRMSSSRSRWTFTTGT